jgi:hypothetical protein
MISLKIPLATESLNHYGMELISSNITSLKVHVGFMSHSWIAARVSSIPINFMSRLVYKKGDRLEVNSIQYRFN